MSRSFLLLLLGSLLVACGEPEDETLPALQADEIHAGQDTVATPLDIDPPPGASQAIANIESVADSGVSGFAQFTEMNGGTRVFAEIGGPGDDVYYLTILNQRSCADVDRPEVLGHQHAAPIGDLGDVDILDDGTGRYERVHPDLHLEGPNSVSGRAVVVSRAPLAGAAGAGQILACGVIGPDLA